VPDEPTSKARQGPDATWKRWLEEAKESGVADTFGSKRRHPRFTWQAHFDLTVTLPDGSSEEYMTSARDISETGLMLFCRESISSSCRAKVSLAGETEAVGVVIRHCTHTLGGYLIGVDRVDEGE
jgi:hypothetical protein